MRLKSLKLFNFRNYSELSLDLSPGINIFIGDNGVGKTNILEAIYVLSLTKSNRYGTINDLIKHDSLSAKINCLVDYDNYTKEYEVLINEESKKVYINKQEIKKIANYISNFCVTTFPLYCCIYNLNIALPCVSTTSVSDSLFLIGAVSLMTAQPLLIQ